MQEKAKGKEYVTSWYEERVQQFGVNDPRSLGYNQRTSQTKRFNALLELGDFHGKKILDVGCGVGDFLQFLLEQGIVPDYTGIDITPGMIKKCEARFQDKIGSICQFEVADTLDYEPSEKFDYVVSSGIFGLLSDDGEKRIIPTIEKFFSWCTIGTASNFLSRQSPRQAEHCLYLDPAKLLARAFELTPAIRMSHSYLPNDFTLYLYKTPAWIEQGETVPEQKVASLAS